MITKEYLKQVFHYNPKSGLFTRLRNSKRYKIGETAGCITKVGYVIIRIDGLLYPAHRLAWLYMYGDYEKILDHKDMCKSNNKIDNLRLANKSENGFNRHKPFNNTSGFKGVTWCAHASKWRAKTKYKNKHIHLGLFITKELAYEAYVNFAKINHGEYFRA